MAVLRSMAQCVKEAHGHSLPLKKALAVSGCENLAAILTSASSSIHLTVLGSNNVIIFSNYLPILTWTGLLEISDVLLP